jgi:hypothetical protein
VVLNNKSISNLFLPHCKINEFFYWHFSILGVTINVYKSTQISSGGARGLMIGVHGGALAAKILDLGFACEVKNSYFTKNFNFPGVLCTPKAAHGSAPANQ